MNCKHPDCYYRSLKVGCCDYLSLTGQRRPCTAGECVGVYEPRNGRRGFDQRHSGQYTKEEQEAELWSCYFAGMSDKEISGEVGTSVGRVKNWRRNNQLPANTRRIDDEFDDHSLSKQKDAERETAGSIVGGSGSATEAAGQNG